MSYRDDLRGRVEVKYAHVSQQLVPIGLFCVAASLIYMVAWPTEQPKTKEPFRTEAAKVLAAPTLEPEEDFSMTPKVIAQIDPTLANKLKTALAQRHLQEQQAPLQTFSGTLDMSKISVQAADPNSTLYEGTLLYAVLETGIDTSLPGKLRAVISQPMYTRDDHHVLIPKGTRLVGYYDSHLQAAQSRVYVMWERMILPSGISIRLMSESTDTLGVSGIKGTLHRHFWDRFSQASLMSMLGGGIATVGVGRADQANTRDGYRQHIAEGFSSSAQQLLLEGEQVHNTITVAPGQMLTVYVARDIDMHTALMAQ